jgi:hypothetical protein
VAGVLYCGTTNAPPTVPQTLVRVNPSIGLVTVGGGIYAGTRRPISVFHGVASSTVRNPGVADHLVAVNTATGAATVVPPLDPLENASAGTWNARVDGQCSRRID